MRPPVPNGSPRTGWCCALAFPKGSWVTKVPRELSMISSTPIGSPISILKEAIGDAFVNIAPEKEAQWRTLSRDLRLDLRVAGADRGPYADAAKKLVVLGIPFLERLWARSFAYYCVYTDLVVFREANPDVQGVPLIRNRRTRRAAELLSWAVDGETGRCRTPWPDGLPRPITDAPQGSDENSADELFLCALAFVQHHEIAHVKLRHPGCRGLLSIEQEKDADGLAADWILSGINQSDPRFRKRALGVVVALAALASLEVYSRTGRRHTHPPAHDRLYQVLNQHISDPNHLAWCFAGVILTLHIQNSHLGERLQKDWPLQTPHRDWVNHLIDVLSRS